jgi:hypothetical protein
MKFAFNYLSGNRLQDVFDNGGKKSFFCRLDFDGSLPEAISAGLCLCSVGQVNNVPSHYGWRQFDCFIIPVNKLEIGRRSAAVLYP